MPFLLALFWLSATLALADAPAAPPDPLCSHVDDSPVALHAMVSGSTVTLSWLAPFGCTPSSYVIAAGSAPNLSNVAQFSTGSSATTLTATGVPAGIYYVRVFSQAGGARTEPSNEIALAVGIACELPGVPQALAATASPTTASLSWDAAAHAPTSYTIEAGAATGLANLAVLNTGSAATSFVTAAPIGTYYVRVRARNGCGTGPASNEVVVAVAAPTPMPSTVTVNTLVELTGAQLVVISSANVTVRNRINLRGNSMLIIRNSVFNHLSDYAGQFDLWAYDDSKVIVENSTINSSVYMSWHFYGRSLLQMTNVVNARTDIWNGFQEHARGTFAHVERAYCTGADGTALEVHHAGQSVVEVVFPPGATVDERFPGVIGGEAYTFPGADDRGIHHTVAITDVGSMSWGITYQPESDITIRDTQGLIVTFKIPSSYSGLTARFDGLRAVIYHDQTWTTGSSRLRLVETATHPWSPIVGGDNTLIITDSELADMTHVNDTATVYIQDSTLFQARAHDHARYTLERSWVAGDVVASDDSVMSMNGGGASGQLIRDPRAQLLVTGARTVSPGFVLTRLGSISTRTGEVLSGTGSIRGSYSGANPFNPFITTDSTRLALGAGRTYRTTFKYRILTAASQRFEALFESPSGYAAGVFLPGFTINGPAGESGAATLTSTLGPYSDYRLNLMIVGSGAIVVDDIQVVDVASGAVVAIEAAETPVTPPPDRSDEQGGGWPRVITSGGHASR